MSNASALVALAAMEHAAFTLYAQGHEQRSTAAKDWLDKHGLHPSDHKAVRTAARSISLLYRWFKARGLATHTAYYSTPLRFYTKISQD